MPTFRRCAPLAALIVLLAVAGCGTSSATALPTATTAPTATPSPTPTMPPAQTYTPTDKFYTVQYPTGWTNVPITANGVADGTIFLSPDDKDYFVIVTSSGTLPASQYVSTFQQFLGGLKATGVKVSATTQKVTAGANSWEMTDAAFTLNGSLYSGAQFVLAHGGRTVIVYTLAPTATFASVGTNFFGPTLNSITFG